MKQVSVLYIIVLAVLCNNHLNVRHTIGLDMIAKINSISILKSNLLIPFNGLVIFYSNIYFLVSLCLKYYFKIAYLNCFVPGFNLHVKKEKEKNVVYKLRFKDYLLICMEPHR